MKETRNFKAKIRELKRENKSLKIDLERLECEYAALVQLTGIVFDNMDLILDPETKKLLEKLKRMK
jgi:hypothetical protein